MVGRMDGACDFPLHVGLFEGFPDVGNSVINGFATSGVCVWSFAVLVVTEGGLVGFEVASGSSKPVTLPPATVGFAVGFAVGFLEGTEDGCLDGFEDGFLDKLGFELGRCEGRMLGGELPVGLTVGPKLGASVST